MYVYKQLSGSQALPTDVIGLHLTMHWAHGLINY